MAHNSSTTGEIINLIVNDFFLTINFDTTKETKISTHLCSGDDSHVQRTEGDEPWPG